MSKAALKQIEPKNRDLKRNVDYLAGDRLEESDFRGREFRIALPKEMADGIETDADLEMRLSNPIFWREAEGSRRFVAGDEFKVIAPNFYARVWLRNYAAAIYADVKVLFKVAIPEDGTFIIDDTGSQGYTVKYMDAHLGFCVLNRDKEIVSSKHYSREKALDDMRRMTASGSA